MDVRIFPHHIDIVTLGGGIGVPDAEQELSRGIRSEVLRVEEGFQVLLAIGHRLHPLHDHTLRDDVKDLIQVLVLDIDIELANDIIVGLRQVILAYALKFGDGALHIPIDSAGPSESIHGRKVIFSDLGQERLCKSVIRHTHDPPLCQYSISSTPRLSSSTWMTARESIVLSAMSCFAR